MNANTQQLVVIAIIGIIAGWLASLVVGGGGILRYLITGVVGAFVGGYIFSALGVKMRLGHPYIEQVVMAAVGAIVVVLLARIIS